MSHPSPRRGLGRSVVIVGVGIVLAAGILVLLVPSVLAILGSAGSVIGSLLPWGLVGLVPAVGVAIAARSKLLAVLSGAFTIAWAVAVVPSVLTPAATGDARLTVLTQNLEASNEDPSATVRALAARGPDVIALEELTQTSGATASDVLASAYPHHYRVGSVGVWSRTTLSDGEPLTLSLDWKRALRVTVSTDLGDVRLYVVHVDSLRLGAEDARPAMLRSLAAEVRADTSDRLVVAGDFNGGSFDPAMRPLRGMLDEGGGWGFTWPAQAPVVRLDHILVRGLQTTSTEVLPADGSDHRGMLSGFR